MSAIQDEINEAIQPVLEELRTVRRILGELKRPDEELLTTAQAAKALGVCEATLRRRVHAGKLGCTRLGGSKMFFTRESIAEFQSRR